MDDMPSPPGADRAPGRLSAELDAAYRAAIYLVVDGGESLRFSVGALAPELDRRIAARGARGAVFLSAENPGSVRLPAEENATRTRALRARLDAAGHAVLDGESRAADGGWREASFLVVGLDEPTATRWARELGQAAIVILEVGKAPRLLAL